MTIMLLFGEHPTHSTGELLTFVDDPLGLVCSREGLDCLYRLLLHFFAIIHMPVARSKMWICSTAGTMAPYMAFDREGWFEVRQLLPGSVIEHLGGRFPLIKPHHGLLSARNTIATWIEWIRHAQLTCAQTIDVWNRLVVVGHVGYLALLTLPTRTALNEFTQKGLAGIRRILNLPLNSPRSTFFAAAEWGGRGLNSAAHVWTMSCIRDLVRL